LRSKVLKEYTTSDNKLQDAQNLPLPSSLSLHSELWTLDSGLFLPDVFGELPAVLCGKDEQEKVDKIREDNKDKTQYSDSGILQRAVYGIDEILESRLP